MEGNELEEVKTVYKAILELDGVMRHSGFGQPRPLKKNLTPHPIFILDFSHARFFLLNDLYPPLMNIYGLGHGTSAVVYHASRIFFGIT